MAGTLERLLTPSRLALIIVALSVAALLVERPMPGIASGYRLTTYAYDANGARGLHEILERLELPVRRRSEGFRSTLRSNATYVLLDPPLDVTRGEVATLLDAVERGAGLIVAATGPSRLTDSLDVRSVFDDLRYAPQLTLIDSAWRVPREGGGTLLPAWPRSFLTFQSPPGSDTVTFVAATSRSRAGGRPLPVVMGLRHGRGRIVVIADPGFLRNDVLRYSRGAVLFVRLIEWVRPTPGAAVVFDEYHQGFGTHANILAASVDFLTGTPIGRALAQLAIAGLVLIVAIGARPIAPDPVIQLQRRSPLEHVGALARAYQRAGAAGTAARRLIHGLRRRHPLAVTRGDDSLYLRTLRARRPALASDITVLEAAIGGAATPRLDRVADAVRRVDLALDGDQ